MTLTIAEKKERRFVQQKRYKQTEAFRKWYQVTGKQREARLRITVKAEVLTHYGRNKYACVICGESRPACLSIDHINGNGCQERKRSGGNRYGYKFYCYLKKNNYPKGYQTLCMNCQFCKAVLDRSWSKVHERKDNGELPDVLPTKL
uniref:Uncharacterized protein n=1 Tax=viral metagenome TaxID=1070528 RepID=A0A6H2A3P1_9ZZZZ